MKVGVCTKSGDHMELKLLSVPFICNRIADVPIELCRRNYDYLKELDFADTSVYQEPALLIGSDYYWKLVSGETIRSTKGPVAVHTELGWVVSGPIADKSCQSATLFTHVLKVDSSPNLRSLKSQLKAFWDLESLGIVDNEDSVHEQFEAKIFMVNGRYEVPLPWKDSYCSIPDNLSLSQGRLKHLLKRLNQSPESFKSMIV